MKACAVAVVVGLIGAPTASYAERVTYDFTGTGWFCPLDPAGTPNCVPEIPYTGQVTIDVRTPLPTGPGSFVGIDAAYAPDGWVASDFIIRWGNNSYSPEAQPFMTSKNEAFVLDDYVTCACDRLDNTEGYSGTDKSGPRLTQYVSTATLTRRTENAAWLSDVSFNLAAGLAPVVTGGDSVNNMNQISFSEYSVGEDWDGFIGLVQLKSLTPRSFATIAIDIEPGNNPKSINPGSKGAIPVAVLGSATFDATQVNPATVGFGPGNASPDRDGKVTDSNRDGRADVVFQFRTDASGIQCGSNTASLRGKTFSGDSFEGSGSIRTVECKKK
jgi:hypothetical protein